MEKGIGPSKNKKGKALYLSRIEHNNSIIAIDSEEWRGPVKEES